MGKHRAEMWIDEDDPSWDEVERQLAAEDDLDPVDPDPDW